MERLIPLTPGGIIRFFFFFSDLEYVFLLNFQPDSAKSEESSAGVTLIGRRRLNILEMWKNQLLPSQGQSVLQVIAKTQNLNIWRVS